jgi:hypothetical protein
LPAQIPTAVRKFASDIAHPVALIGCRASETPLDCCEYDLAVFAPGENRVVQVGEHAVELVHFAGPAKNHVVDLGRMVVLKDTKFALSSAAGGVPPEKYRKALAAAGKKSLISSLFCQQRMATARHPVAGAMWLKIAAYEFVGGMLALSGTRPMPLHELEQVRQADAGEIADGIEVALECIAIERATRPAISRSIKAILELKSNDYDRELFASKADHLLGRSMLADCYYYAGRIAAKNLAGRKEPFYSQYEKLIQVALDLSSDVQHLEKLQKKLFRAASGGLKG